MNTKTFPLTIAAIALISATLLGAAQAKGGSATALGIELGGSCQQGVAVLGQSTMKPLGGDLVLHEAKNPAAIFPRAQQVLMRCAGDRVLAIALVMPKGAPGNAEAKQMYQVLNKKYKRIDGGPIDHVRDSYALFATDSSIVKLVVPHMSFDFDVAYYTKDFWEELQAKEKKRDADVESAKRKL